MFESPGCIVQCDKLKGFYQNIRFLICVIHSDSIFNEHGVHLGDFPCRTVSLKCEASVMAIREREKLRGKFRIYRRIVL